MADQSLADLRDAILADGVVDADEVKKLRECLYADDTIDQEEAEFLFALNDSVSGKPNDSSWQVLFVDAICDYLLKDEQSPGVVDSDEATWLLEKIQGDGQLDATERALLTELASRSTSLDEKLAKFIASA